MDKTAVLTLVDSLAILLVNLERRIHVLEVEAVCWTIDPEIERQTFETLKAELDRQRAELAD